MAAKRKRKKKMSWKEALAVLVLAAVVSLAGGMDLAPGYDLSAIPEHDVCTSAYVVLERNQPGLTHADSHHQLL